MTHLFNSRRRCVPSLGSQARLGQEHTGDLQKECCTNRRRRLRADRWWHGPGKVLGSWRFWGARKPAQPSRRPWSRPALKRL